MGNYILVLRIYRIQRHKSIKLRCDKYFKHVIKKTIYFPTKTRNPENDLVIVENIELFLNGCKFNLTSEYSSRSFYYGFSIWIELEICKYLSEFNVIGLGQQKIDQIIDAT
ncbi:hypothetical protein K502DRAFT_346025 [Neoconidiobolus thromboides FSU 785]|nr:hypothetical protein K502DRAFT_346025 [Neoconidiobolus thromboides FSU 785]